MQTVAEKRAYQKAWRAANPERCCELARQWRANNPERAKELGKQYRERYPDKYRAKYRADSEKRHAADPAKTAARVREWRRANPGKNAAIKARRRAAEFQATPAWVDHTALRSVYQLAAFMGLHVDHIEPLAGKTACRLHVPWNLQLLTGSQNATKGNRIDSGIVGIRA